MSSLRAPLAAALLFVAACSTGGAQPPAVARARVLAVAAAKRAPAAPLQLSKSPTKSPGAASTESPADAGDALGKKVFLEKCASCHDADGTKPLDGGPPLSARSLALEVVQKTVDGRLSSGTAEERGAVARYIVGLMSPRPASVAAR